MPSRRLRSFALLRPAAVVLTAACASAGVPREAPPAPGASGTTDVVSARLSTTGSDDATRLLSYNVETAYTVTLTGTTSQALDAAAQAYATLFERRPEVVDAERRVSSGLLRSMSTIAGERPAVWFDCGQDAQGIDRANSHRITMQARTTVKSAPGGQVTLETYLSGEARTMTTSGEPFPCRSTGRLEKRLHAEAAKRLTVK